MIHSVAASDGLGSLLSVLSVSDLVSDSKEDE